MLRTGFIVLKPCALLAVICNGLILSASTEKTTDANNKMNESIERFLNDFPKNKMAAMAANVDAKITEPLPPKYDIVNIIAKHPNAAPAKSNAYKRFIFPEKRVNNNDNARPAKKKGMETTI